MNFLPNLFHHKKEKGTTKKDVKSLKDLSKVDERKCGSRVKLTELSEDGYEKLRDLLGSVYLENVRLRYCFHTADKLSEILICLRENEQAESFKLDIRNNKHDAECVTELCKLIVAKKVCSLRLPERLDETSSEEILHTIWDEGAKMKKLDMSHSVLNGDSIKYLGKILEQKLISDCLKLEKCVGPSETSLTSNDYGVLLEAAKGEDSLLRGIAKSIFWYQKLEIVWFTHVKYAGAGSLDETEWEVKEVHTKRRQRFRDHTSANETIVRKIATNKKTGEAQVILSRKRRKDEEFERDDFTPKRSKEDEMMNMLTTAMGVLNTGNEMQVEWRKKLEFLGQRNLPQHGECMSQRKCQGGFEEKQSPQNLASGLIHPSLSESQNPGPSAPVSFHQGSQPFTDMSPKEDYNMQTDSKAFPATGHHSRTDVDKARTNYNYDKQLGPSTPLSFHQGSRTVTDKAPEEDNNMQTDSRAFPATGHHSGTDVDKTRTNYNYNQQFDLRPSPIACRDSGTDVDKARNENNYNTQLDRERATHTPKKSEINNKMIRNKETGDNSRYPMRQERFAGAAAKTSQTEYFGHDLRRGAIQHHQYQRELDVGYGIGTGEHSTVPKEPSARQVGVAAQANQTDNFGRDSRRGSNRYRQYSRESIPGSSSTTGSGNIAQQHLPSKRNSKRPCESGAGRNLNRDHSRMNQRGGSRQSGSWRRDQNCGTAFPKQAAQQQSCGRQLRSSTRSHNMNQVSNQVVLNIGETRQSNRRGGKPRRGRGRGNYRSSTYESEV